MESHEIVPREAEFEHGGLADQVGMKSVPVIAVQPMRQLGDALARAVVSGFVALVAGRTDQRGRMHAGLEMR